MAIVKLNQIGGPQKPEVSVVNYSALRQQDKYQTGVAIFRRKKDNKCVAIPLYSWDLTSECEEHIASGEYSEVVSPVMKTMQGDDVEFVIGARLFKDTYGILSELRMEAIRNGILDYTYTRISPNVPVFRYN